MRSLRQNEMRVKGGSHDPKTHPSPVRIEPPSVESDPGFGIRMIAGEIFFDLDKAVIPFSTPLPLGKDFDRAVIPFSTPKPTD